MIKNGKKNPQGKREGNFPQRQLIKRNETQRKAGNDNKRSAKEMGKRSG